MSLQEDKTQSNDEIVTENTSETEVKRKRSFHAYDYGLLILTIFFVGLGLVFLYSTSSYTATQKFGTATFYLKRQGSFALIGILAMLIVSRIDYKLYIEKFRPFGIRAIYLLYALCLFLQTIVLFVADEIYGAKRWLEIPKIGSFQPSEVTKICVIIFTAFIVYAAPKKMNSLGGIVRAGVYIAPLVLLVGKEDLSTAIVLLGIFFVICFVSSKRWWYMILGALVAGGGVAAYIFLGDGFRGRRISEWLNIDGSSESYQIRRGLYAIASGDLTGKGLGESSMKLGYVPESHNDMIFSIICEELGIIGAVCIILLFVLMIWRIYTVAINASDLFGSFLCIGVMAHIGIQVLMNIAVVTNTIPATGIALPFISYGGTSLVLLLCEIGMVLSVSYHIEYSEK